MSLGYIIKEGLAGFGRAKLASATSMFSLFIAVFLIGVMARFAYNIYDVAKTIRSSIKVEVFLEELDQRSTRQIKQQLEKAEVVRNIMYISKDSAAAIFKEEFGPEGGDLAELNFLPASFRISINPESTISEISSFTQKVADYSGVEEVTFNRQLLEVLEARLQNMILVGGGLVVLILLTAMVLVFNTIRLTIYAKRGLIKAMKLVGATHAFIRRPFLVEGIIQGLIAGGFALIFHYLLFQFLIPMYIPQFGVLAWPFERWYYLVAALMLLAIFMGFFGSRWAARTFIKDVSISS